MTAFDYVNPDLSTDLKGSTALVTGSTTGLGRAIAQALAVRGAHVVVHGRDAERGAAVVSELGAIGGTGEFLAADFADPAQVARLADKVGGVDVLVNNAGWSSWAPTADLAVADLDGMFATNVRAPFLLVAAIAPRMAERGRGSIISIGSMSGTIGMVNGAAYGATKAALGSLTQSWAAEYGAAGVRVNIIAPGPIQTRPAAKETFDAMGKLSPLGRAASPAEIAETVAFLASPRASYITGAIIAVDGGRTAL